MITKEDRGCVAFILIVVAIFMCSLILIAITSTSKGDDRIISNNTIGRHPLAKNMGFDTTVYENGVPSYPALIYYLVWDDSAIIGILAINQSANLTAAKLYLEKIEKYKTMKKVKTGTRRVKPLPTTIL